MASYVAPTITKPGRSFMFRASKQAQAAPSSGAGISDGGRHIGRGRGTGTSGVSGDAGGMQ
eukprot:345855-Lingulodinium_polyedra.AAC.1